MVYTHTVAKGPRALGEFGSIYVELDDGCVVETDTEELEQYDHNGVLFKYEFKTVLKNAQGVVVRTWRTKTAAEALEATDYYCLNDEVRKGV